MVGVRPELTHQRVGMMRVLDLLGVKSAQLQLLLLPFLLFGGSLGIRSEDLNRVAEREESFEMFEICFMFHSMQWTLGAEQYKGFFFIFSIG